MIRIFARIGIIMLAAALIVFSGIAQEEPGKAAAGPDTCKTCHDTEAFQRQTAAWEASGHKPSVTCGACHEFPHNSKEPKQLKTDPETLCTSCHFHRSVLQGKGAKGLDEMRSFHSAVDCTSCHMTEANHRMTLIRPDDPKLPPDRLDTCTRCHKDNNRKARAEQIREWQSHYAEEMEPLKKEVASVAALLKEKPDLLDEGLKKKWADLTANLEILEKDGSRGVHNVDFTGEILLVAKKHLAEIKAALR